MQNNPNPHSPSKLSSINVTPNKSVLCEFSTIKKSSGFAPSRVVNSDYLLSLGDIYKCNICFNIMNNPTDCDKCGHSYCLECISHLKCPFNCSSSKPKPSSVAIKMLLNGIIFKCENESCEERLSYNNIALHDQECENKPTKCPSPNCLLQVGKKNLERHIKEECKFVYLPCKFCANDFFRGELEEHEENCEIVYVSLNSVNRDKLQDKIKKNKDKENANSLANSNANKFIEALSINISKIIKDQETKFNELEAKNSNIKENLESNFKILLEEIKNEKKSQTINEDENLKDIKQNTDSIGNLEMVLNKFENKIDNLIKTSFNQIFENNLNDVIIKKIKQILDLNHDKIINHLDNPKVSFDSINNTFSKTQAEIVTPEENNEELANLIVNALKLSQDNINENITEIKQEIIKKIEASTDEINSSYSKFNSLVLKLIESKLIETNENTIKKLKDTVRQKEEDILNLINERIELDVNRVTSNISKNVIETIRDGEDSLKENLETLTENIRKMIEELLIKEKEEKEENEAQFDILVKNTKETNKIINEEISDLNEKLLDKTELIERFDSLNKRFSDLEDRLTNNIEIKLKEAIINNSTKWEEKSNGSILSDMDDKFSNLESKINKRIDEKWSEMYSLKWCRECEKVDYFFAFINCPICKKESCKSCVSLCKTCRAIFCKKCLTCPKCPNYSCLNCRSVCEFCSFSKGDRFCSQCMCECMSCKKATCGECIKQCISCKNLSCSECSKFCRICSKASCMRCETSKNFRKCSTCLFISCFECTVNCITCEGEVCRSCFLTCKRCKSVHCRKCGMECGMCNDTYCGNCSKEFNQNKCNICHNLFCTICVKNFRKCKICKESACKSCQAQCKKCKNYFCNNCNLNCDNCNEYTCSSCVYKCVCDSLIFCEKCLLDINPIGPHDCVLFMNDSPDFKGLKTRSKISLPKNFEAKLFLEKFEGDNLIIGVTDNNTFSEDTLSFVDNVWTLKVKTGQKYSTKKSLEPYTEREARERDFVIVAVKNDNLYFRINFDDNPPAFQLPSNRQLYIYCENDSTNSFYGNVKVKFVYIRKI